jgi:hypothetical protein
MIWFTSIQKTASTSLATLLDKREKHIGKAKVLHHGYFYDPWESQEEKEKYWLNFGWSDPIIGSKVKPEDIIFATVRNPFDIFVSYYLHAREDGWAKVRVVHNIRTFDEFVDRYIDPSFKWHLPPMKHSMYSFIKYKDGRYIPDGYFKVEEIEKLNQFLKTLGYSGLPFENKTFLKTEHYSKYFKPTQVDALTEIWKEDLFKFGYQYEN